MRSRSLPGRLRLLVLCAARFMLILDVVVVNVAIPAIQRDLGGSAARMSLVGVADTPTFGVRQLTAGRAGDRNGRRRLFTFGIAIFSGASRNLALGVCGSRLRLVPADGTYLAHVLPGLLLVAIGSGLTYAPAYIAGTSGVPDESQGLASGVPATGQELGAAGGLGFVALLASSSAGVTAMLAQYRAGFAWAAGLAVLAVLVAASAPRGVGAAISEKDLEGVR